MAEPVETWRATITTPSDPDVAAASLWQGGAIAVELAGADVVGFFPVHPTDPDPPRVPETGWMVEWTRLPAVDHMAAWRNSSMPVRAGGFELVPAHLADTHPTSPGLHRIVIDAGLAFGSGHHDTTAGCLESLADVAVTGRRILDVGTGTGILAIAAALAGAAEVVGVDTDPQAIEVARTNAATNDVPLDLAVGSTDEVDGPFDGILANLLTGLLVELAPALAALSRPGAWLVASGIGIPRTGRVTAALHAAGFTTITARHRGDWTVLMATRGSDEVGMPGRPRPDTTDRPRRWPQHDQDTP